MKPIIIILIIVAALAAAIHLGGGRFHSVLRSLHGGTAGVHGGR